MRRALAQRRPQDLAGVDDRRREAARGDEMMARVPVLGVEEDHPEVLAVVVVGGEKLAGKVGGLLRARERGPGRGAVLPGHGVGHSDPAVAVTGRSRAASGHGVPPLTSASGPSGHAGTRRVPCRGESGRWRPGEFQELWIDPGKAARDLREAFSREKARLLQSEDAALRTAGHPSRRPRPRRRLPWRLRRPHSGRS